MIEYVVLHNFQIHADKRIDFNKDITFITGENGSGKSSVFRAITWVALNKGNSKQFRRILHDGSITDETRVEIGLEGHKIERIVSNTKNEYWMDGKKLTGFGRGVPEEVSALFRMTDLNISEQFSPLFLVGDASGAIADELISIVSLEKMDALVDAVNADVRKYNEAITATNDKKSSIQNIITVLGSVKYTISPFSTELNELIYARDCSVQKINELESVLSLDKSCIDMKNYLQNGAEFSIDDIERVDKLNAECVILCDILNYFDKNPEFSIDIPEIEVIFPEYNLNELETLLMNLNDLNGSVSSTKAQLKEVQQELSTYSICPLCGHSLEGCSHE